MDIKGKYKSKVQQVGLSCDAFSTGCLVMCLLFFVPYVASNGGAIVMWFLPIACLMPFAVMPLVYMFIHRFDTLLFGRYHFVMPVSAFIASPFFVMAWSADGNGPSQSCLIFFGILIFVLGITIYRYCAFSVRSRLTYSGIVDKCPYYEVVCAFGCVAAAGAFAGFMHYDMDTAYINTAYVMGGATVLIALSQYLITFYGIPRLGGRRTESIKSVFESFYRGINVKMYLSALFFESAFAVIAALSVYLGFVLDIGLYGAVFVAAAFIAAYGLCAAYCSRRINRRSITLSVFNLLCAVVSTIALVIVCALNAGGNGGLAGLTVAAVVAGAGGAVSVRQSKLRLLNIKPHMTNGTAFIISELTVFAAAGIAMFAAALVTAVYNIDLSAMAFVYGFAVALLLAVTATVLACKPTPAPTTVTATEERQ